MRLLFLSVYFVLIAVLSLLPSNRAAELILFERMDLLAHAGMYFGMAFLLRWGLCYKSPDDSLSPERKHAPATPASSWMYQLSAFLGSFRGAVFVSAGIGISLELAQGIFKSLNRDFSLLDMAANTLGAFLGAWAYLLLPRLFRRPLTRS